jgi:hypothetical protein
MNTNYKNGITKYLKKYLTTTLNCALRRDYENVKKLIKHKNKLIKQSGGGTQFDESAKKINEIANYLSDVDDDRIDVKLLELSTALEKAIKSVDEMESKLKTEKNVLRLIDSDNIYNDVTQMVKTVGMYPKDVRLLPTYAPHDDVTVDDYDAKYDTLRNKIDNLLEQFNGLSKYTLQSSKSDEINIGLFDKLSTKLGMELEVKNGEIGLVIGSLEKGIDNFKKITKGDENSISGDDVHYDYVDDGDNDIQKMYTILHDNVSSIFNKIVNDAIDSYKQEMGNKLNKDYVNVKSQLILLGNADVNQRASIQRKFYEDVKRTMNTISYDTMEKGPKTYDSDGNDFFDVLQQDVCTAFSKDAVNSENYEKSVYMAAVGLKELVEKDSLEKKLEYDFANKYNKLSTIVGMDVFNSVGQLFAPPTKLVQKLFCGRYVRVVKNNMFVEQSMPTLVVNVGDGSNESEVVEPKKTLDELYLGPTQTIIKGGSISSVMSRMNNLSDKLKTYYTNIKKYKECVVSYNEHNMHYVYHTMFFISIITKSMHGGAQVIYEYMNKGTLTLYNRILGKIIDEINVGKSTDDIKYFKKYHMYTLLKLFEFTRLMINQMDVNKRINIEMCKGYVRDCFLLLNYFKNILETYNETFNSKVTIFARINDIPKKGEKLPPQDSAQLLDNKIFVSDYEMKEYLGTISNPRSIIDSMNIPNDMLREHLENHILLGHESDVNYKLLYVNNKLCNKGTSQKFVGTKFTEVFDTSQYKDNASMAKYMSLDTQLSKGQGVMMLTYGYSGTGKTFTLFGTNGIQGLLQSTLDNIIGLENMYFRTFELYGYGTPYIDYWAKGNDLIDQQIYLYSLSLKGNKIISAKPELSRGAEMKQKLEDNNFETYLEINQYSISKVFENFEDFTKDINEIRKNAGRVRSTPNNRESSRSILIYDFKLKIAGVYGLTQLVIVDLPGREKIIETYVNPFVEPEPIQHMLIDEFSQIRGTPSYEKINTMIKDSGDYIPFCKFLLNAITLNPLNIGMCDPNLFLEVFNRFDEQHRTYIIDEPRYKKYDLFLGSFNRMFMDILLHGMSTNIKLNDKKTLIHGQFTLNDELIYPNGYNVKLFFNIENYRLVPKTFNDITSMLKFFNIKYLNNIIDSSTDVNNLFGRLVGPIGINTLDQVKMNICTIIMSRIIEFNMFDCAQRIYEAFADKYINNLLKRQLKKAKTEVRLDTMVKSLIDTKFKSEELNDMMTKPLDINIVVNCVKFDYYMTPYEGIYINENIMGLMKFISSEDRLIPQSAKRDMYTTQHMKKQSEDQDFSFLQKKSNLLSIVRYTGLDDEQVKRAYVYKSTIPPQLLQFNEESGQLSYDIHGLDQECELSKKQYDPNKIFMFKNPSIQQILQPYVTNDKTTKTTKDGNSLTINPITEYKVFYLFGNNLEEEVMQMKCDPQIALFDNTISFINLLTMS